MHVGFNYPWPFDADGYTIGPYPWDDKVVEQLYKDTLEPNLIELKALGVEVVRFFLLGNGYNYGKLVNHPLFRNPIWEPPKKLDWRFTAFWEFILQKFDHVGIKILPSFIHFEMLGPNLEGRKIVANPANTGWFLDEVLEPLLTISENYRDSIYCWEVINEPAWNVRHVSNISL